MVNSSNPTELQEKLKEILSDEDFARSLLELDAPADVQKALAQKGVALTEEELVQIRDALIQVGEHGGELTEEELEEVAGGFIVGAIAIFTALFVAGVLINGILMVEGKQW